MVWEAYGIGLSPTGSGVSRQVHPQPAGNAHAEEDAVRPDDERRRHPRVPTSRTMSVSVRFESDHGDFSAVGATDVSSGGLRLRCSAGRVPQVDEHLCFEVALRLPEEHSALEATFQVIWSRRQGDELMLGCTLVRGTLGNVRCEAALTRYVHARTREMHHLGERHSSAS